MPHGNSEELFDETHSLWRAGGFAASLGRSVAQAASLGFSKVRRSLVRGQYIVTKKGRTRGKMRS